MNPPTIPDMDMNEVQFMSLYSFANWPRVIISRVWRMWLLTRVHICVQVWDENRSKSDSRVRLTLIVSFIGGFLIDQYFGLSDGGVIFALINIISQVFMSIGVFVGNKGLCYFASVIFGAAGPVVIAQAWSWVIFYDLYVILSLESKVDQK